MPFGSYKVVAWGGGTDDAPVMPAGLTQVNWNQFLVASSQIYYTGYFSNLSEIQNVKVITMAANQNATEVNCWFLVGYNDANNTYAIAYAANNSSSTVTSPFGAMISAGSSAIYRSPPSLYYLTVKGTGNGNWSGMNFMLPSAGANVLKMKRWSGLFNYLGPSGYDTTTYTFANAPSGPTPAWTNASFSMDTFYIQTSNSTTNNFSCFAYTGNSFNNSGNLVAYYNQEGGTGVDMGINGSVSNATSWGNHRICAFNTPANLQARILGYGSVTGGTYKVFSLYSDQIVINPYSTLVDTGITCVTPTTNPILPAKIWNTLSTSIMAVIFNAQYLQLYKINNWALSSPSFITSPLIYLDGPPNESYRIKATNIDGLAVLFYLDPVDSQLCYYRWVTTTSDAQTVKLSDPIFLFNTGRLTSMFSVDLKYTSGGFQIIVGTMDYYTSDLYCNVFYLWPQQARNMYVNWNNQPMPYALQTAAGSTTPRLSNVRKKFGQSSLFCDTTSRLAVANVSVFNKMNIGTGDFTLEFWYQPLGSPTVSNFPGCFQIGNAGPLGIWAGKNPIGGGLTNLLYFWMNSPGPTAGTTIASTTTLIPNNWYHIAIVRSSGTISMYLNGIFQSSMSNSTDMNLGTFGATPATLNCQYNTTGSDQGTGYYDEFRFSNIARYTSNFNVQTAPFTNDINTCILLHFNGEENSRSFYDDWGPNYSG